MLDIFESFCSVICFDRLFLNRERTYIRVPPSKHSRYLSYYNIFRLTDVAITNCQRTSSNDLNDSISIRAGRETGCHLWLHPCPSCPCRITSWHYPSPPTLSPIAIILTITITVRGPPMAMVIVRMMMIGESVGGEGKFQDVMRHGHTKMTKGRRYGMR